MPTDHRLSPRLGRYLAACAAVTAAAAHHAAADINYWPDANLVIPANIDGLYINVENRTFGAAGAEVPGWDINPYSATSLTWFNATGTGMLRFPGVTTGSAGSLALNTPVGATGSYGSGAVTVGTAPGNWRLNSDNYFGFRFVGSDGLTHYGWGKFVIGSAINGADRTITELAWETVGATPILVGNTGGPPPAYDPCATTNPTVSNGANSPSYRSDDTVANLSTSCGTVFKANYYKFTPTVSGDYVIDTCLMTDDTRLAVLAGCEAGSAVLTCNDNACGSGSRVTLSADGGFTYYVVVGSASSTPLVGPVRITVTPPYDPCATSNPTLATGTSNVAVNQLTTGNLNVGGMVITRANYYKFTPSASGEWTFNTCASEAATRMAVLSDCTPGATVIASNDNGCGGSSQSSSVTATLSADLPVYVVVGGQGADIPSPIRVDVAGPPVQACAEATVAVYGANAIDNTTSSGSQPVQSNAANTTAATVNRPVWLKFTPSATGDFQFSYCGSTGDSLLAIGQACPTVGSRFLTLAFNDDSCTLQSCIDSTNCGATGTFAGFPLAQQLVAGQTYLICIGGYGATTAVTGVLNITGPEGPACQADLNDDGFVNGDDLGILLGQWGACSSACSADFNNDGFVNGDDLGVMLGAWGACP